MTRTYAERRKSAQLAAWTRKIHEAEFELADLTRRFGGVEAMKPFIDRARRNVAYYTEKRAFEIDNPVWMYER